MCFRNYGLRKPWLDKFLKSTVLEDSWKSNMVNRPKQCWNLNHSTFSIFIDQCESNWVGKSLTLTPGQKFRLLNTDKLTQPIKIQLSKKQKAFSEWFSAFLKCGSNFEHFQELKTLIADVFPKLRLPENVVR